MTPQALATAIQDAWKAELRAGSNTPSNANNVYASRYSPCVRQLVLDMSHGDQTQGWSEDQLARFARGRERERSLLITLDQVGQRSTPRFHLEGGQERFKLTDRKGRTAMTGKVDSVIVFEAEPRIKGRIEIKAWSQWLTDRIECFEDLFRNRWTRRGAYQLLAYLLGANTQYGFMVLDRPGLPKILPVDLYANLERIERFLADAEIAMDHKEAKSLPPFIDDPEECRYCQHFKTNCQPPIRTEGATVVTDPIWIERLDRYWELKESIGDDADELERLDRQIKAAFRGVEIGLVGSYMTRGRWQKQTTYPIPDDIKAPYRKVEERGKWFMEIVKVNSES